MLGFLRTSWALMVVVGHLFWVGDFGRFAVFGFYILSGFLMTTIMHQSYGYSLKGLRKFSINRFLRLFPTYWLVCIIAIVIIFYAPVFESNKFGGLGMPESISAIFGNATLIYPNWIPSRVGPRLSPATWALTVELFYYLLIALGISRTYRTTVIWVVFSLCFVLLTYAFGFYWHSRYFSIPAGSLPFSLGALIFFMTRTEITNKTLKALTERPLFLFFLMLSISAFASYLVSISYDYWFVEVLFYLSMIVSFLLVLSLARGKVLIKSISRELDSKIGHFSYPVYLLHYQAAALASLILYGDMVLLKRMEEFSLTLVILSLIFLFLLSYLTINLVDNRVEKLRLRVKKL